MVQLIDLDAAMRQGSNRALIEQIAQRLPCQVGGGIGSIERAQEMLAAGARRVIIGSALFDAAPVAEDGTTQKLVRRGPIFGWHNNLLNWGLSVKRCIRRFLLVAFSCRESVAESDGEGVQSGLPAHCPSGPAGHRSDRGIG